VRVARQIVAAASPRRLWIARVVGYARGVQPLLERIDHLVYATPDVEATIEELERRLGVRATPGGSHPKRGTRNALITIGASSYLEIVGPDSAQSVAGPRWFGIDGLTAPRLVTWAAKSNDLDGLAEHAADRGVSIGAIMSGGRARPDGSTISWRNTDPTTWLGDGIVPFFIDWGESDHPSSAAVPGPPLVALRAEHPSPARVRAVLETLGIDLDVAAGSRPRLVATFAAGRGSMDLS